MSWLHQGHELHKCDVTQRGPEPAIYSKCATAELDHAHDSSPHQAACHRAVAPWGESLTNKIGGVDGGALYRLGLAEAHTDCAVAN